MIDPLDGTTNFIHGFPQYCVSIALKYKGKLEHAVIYDPNRDEEFTASRGRGAALNGRRIRCTNRPGLEGCLIGTGFPFRKDQAPHMDAYLGMFADIAASTAGLRRPGSAALDLAWLAAGRLDGFFEFGLSEWDLAAGALLITGSRWPGRRPERWPQIPGKRRHRRRQPEGLQRVAAEDQTAPERRIASVEFSIGRRCSRAA